MEKLVGISIGIIVGLCTSLDLIFTKKKTYYGFVIRNILFNFVMNIPRIIGSYMGKDSLYTVFSFLMVTFVISVIIGVVIDYLFYLRLKARYNASLIKNEVITFVDLFCNGYKELTEKIKQGIQNEKELESNRDETLIKTIHNFGEDLPTFIKDIYFAAFYTKDPLTYVLTVMESFVSKFLSENEARFTIRKLEPNSREMICFKTTKNSRIPSGIPIDKTNMISKSLEINHPLVYSKNKEYHYDTGKSIKQGKYIDYVAYCLVVDKTQLYPLFSVNLEVKTVETQKKMLALVETSLFQVICEPIKLRLEEYAKQEGLLNEEN